MTATAIIRQRGQLTIPEKFRTMFSWLSEGEVVGFDIEDEVVVIRPHIKTGKKNFDWEAMWRKIELSRSFKGKRGNLSQLIAEDRENH